MIELHEYVWETSNGEQVYVRDMETSHLKNTIAFIERHDFQSTLVLGNGDIDETYVDEVFVDWRPVYERMLIELRLRKLEGTA